MSRVTYSASPPAQSKKYITRSKSFVRKKTKKSYFDYSLMFLIMWPNSVTWYIMVIFRDREYSSGDGFWHL